MICNEIVFLYQLINLFLYSQDVDFISDLVFIFFKLERTMKKKDDLFGPSRFSSSSARKFMVWVSSVMGIRWFRQLFRRFI